MAATLGRQPLSVDVSPDGETMLTSGGDGAVSLWDTDTGASIGSPLVTSSGALMFGPAAWTFGSFGEQGRAIVAVVAGGGGQVWTWPADPDRWAERACSVAGRDLTATERAEFGIAPGLTVCPAA